MRANGDLASVVDRLNAEHGASYVLRERFPAGTEGAWLVEDAAGGQYVLKFEPGARELAPLPAVLRTLSRLGARGYPVPRYVAWGVHPRPPVGRYTLQQKLPGDEAPRIDDALLDQILALNDLQAGMGLPETVPPGGWRRYIVGPIVGDERVTEAPASPADGDHAGTAGGAGIERALPFPVEEMRRYSAETAALVECLQDYVRAHARAPMATGDVVHFDFGKGHVWTEIVPDPAGGPRVHPGKITGIIDFEGLVTGDRVFDLVTTIFYNHGPAYREGPARRLWDRACALAGAETVGVYLAHITLRQTGGCVRHHTDESTRYHLECAAQTWHEFRARAGAGVRSWR